jgi:hypothetical protein
MPDTALANLLLVIHFAWVAWMISGIIIAIFGFRWPRLWEWRIFRIAHLIGLVGTASTPLWPGGLCPLTIWEWQLRDSGGDIIKRQSFIIHWLHEMLYWDVDPIILSMISAIGAVLTVVIFILRPPWKSYRHRSS